MRIRDVIGQVAASLCFISFLYAMILGLSVVQSRGEEMSMAEVGQ